MEINARALRERMPDGEALRRYDRVATILTGKKAEASEAIKWVAELCQALQVPGLSAYGVTENDSGKLVAEAVRASSTKANPIVLTPEELAEALQRSL
jgi:alcohol dehydrogenase class IV